MKIKNKFSNASRKASRAMMDQELAKRYCAAAKGKQTGFDIALNDASHPPIIEFISAEINNNGVRDKIIICATDDFKVVKVKVKIINGTDELIEGDAVFELKDVWSYATIHRNKIIAGAKIIATVIDLAKNKTSLEIELYPSLCSLFYCPVAPSIRDLYPEYLLYFTSQSNLHPACSHCFFIS